MKRIPVGAGIIVVLAAAIAVTCAQDRDGLTRAATAAEQQSRVETLVIPYGTCVVAALDVSISTETNRSGDRFSATTVGPIVVDGRTVIAAGARINGILRDVRAAGRIKGRARMTLICQGIVDLADRNHAIMALPLTLRAASAPRGGAGRAAAGNAPAAIVGAIASEEGGAALEAGNGTILVPATETDEVELRAGQRLKVWTVSPTSVGVLAQR